MDLRVASSVNKLGGAVRTVQTGCSDELPKRIGAAAIRRKAGYLADDWQATLDRQAWLARDGGMHDGEGFGREWTSMSIVSVSNISKLYLAERRPWSWL